MSEGMLWLLLLAGGVAWHMHMRRWQQRHEEQEQQLRELQQLQATLSSQCHETNDVLDTLFSSVEESVLRIDATGRVLAANQQAREVFHITGRMKLPQSLIVFFRDHEWYQAYHAALDALPQARDLPDIHIEHSILAPRLVPLEHGQALLLCVDVTSRVRAAKQRKNLYANLAHDLKTPLTSIEGYARSLRTFADDAEFREEAVAAIVQGAERVTRMLDALLSMEQLDSAGGAHQCHVQGAVEHVFADMQDALDGIDVQLHFSESAEQPVVAMDCLELERVLRNIIENALYHAKDMRGLQCFVRVEDAMCCIEMADDGDGVRDDALPYLMERFYRQSKERAQDEGHGLGLAIVKELVEARGGSARCAHHEPQGLAIHLRIPLVVEGA